MIQLNKFIFFILFLLCSFINAQFYEFGQEPSSLKWLQMDTEHFKLIYPDDFSRNAAVIANKLEKNYSINSVRLNFNPRKIPVIFHNQTVISNGFVGIAPRRMEFFTFPDPNLSGMDWLSELCIHEFRHACQVDKLNKSTTKILSLAAGEIGTGLVAAMIPFWLLEGDAVTAETQYTNSGRGRLPSFEMEIKAQLLSSRKPYSFSKSYFGSYKDFVADYWRYGYQVVSYSRKLYGENFWNNAIDYVARNPYLTFPLRRYMKLQTGTIPNRMHFKTMNYLKNYWKGTLSERGTEEIPSLTKRKKSTYTSYTQAKFLNDGTVISYKSGINFNPRFVQIDSLGKEKKIFVPGTLHSGKISVYDSKIIWDELTYDPRWRNRNYSIIKEYDMKTGLSRKLTSLTRYSSPEFSSTGDTIAVIEITPGYEFFIVLLSADSGNILNRIPSPDNCFLQDPAWIGSTKEIAVISVNDKGERILSCNLTTQSWREIYNAGYFNLSELAAKGKYLYFNASFNGIDNIYSINIIDLTLFKLSNSKFGAFQPDISRDNSGIIYSDYSEKGYDLKIDRNAQNELMKYIVPDKIIEQPYFTIDNKKENPQNILSQTDTVKFKTKPYNKFAHLFKIHSWTPFYFDYNDPQVDDLKVSPGISIFSQNHLSTAVSSLSYEYKDKTSYIHTGFTYKGLYPVFEFTLVYGGKTQVVKEQGADPPPPETNLNYSLLGYIPLILNTGKFSSGLRPYAKFTYSSKYYFHSRINEYKNGNIFFEPGLFLYSYLRTCQRDLQPKLGLTIHLRSINTPFESELFGSNNSYQTSIYLPGLLRNQGIKFKIERQNQITKKYLFNNLITFPRGFEQIPSVSLIKYTGDYVMPLIYPDINLGTILYLKRLRADAFVDYMKGWDIYDATNNSGKVFPFKEFLSEGLELYADYHIFHIIFEFSSGIRFTYLPDDRKVKYEFLFTVNLNKF